MRICCASDTAAQKQKIQTEGGNITLDNVILIGMPGAGKSTIGVVLAKIMKMDFCDTDLVIQKMTGRALQDILDSDGLLCFIETEKNAVLSLNCDKCVIATGGSVVLSAEAMEHLKKLGTLVYLRADFESIVSRIHNIDTRGLAFDKGQTLLDIFEQRVPMYEKYCDFCIDCGDFDCFSAAEKIKKLIHN